MRCARGNMKSSQFMSVIDSILFNVLLFILSSILYVFIAFSAGFASSDKYEMHAWMVFLSCVALHIAVFTRVWKKKNKQSYLIGLTFTIIAYAMLIVYYAIKPAGTLP